MAKSIKSISHTAGLLHIETPLGIINIRAGLRDDKGRRVDSIEILTSGGERYAGEPVVHLEGFTHTRLVEDTPGCPPFRAKPADFYRSISDLEISRRAARVLNENGCAILADVCHLTRERLWTFPGVGRITVTEIRRALEAYGMRLGMTVTEIPPRPPEAA